MNLHDVRATPAYQAITQKIMAEVGLDQPPKFYNSVFAYERRCAAAAELPAAIERAHKEGKQITPPVEDLIRFARTCASGLEKNFMSLCLTYEVMEMIIYSHIWLSLLNKPFERSMAKQGCEKILLSLIGFGPMGGGGGGCSGDCGSCGGH